MNSSFRTLQANFIDGISAGRNYIANGGSNQGVTQGWVTYADAAGSVPVDGTGGSPSITLSSSSTGPMSGDFSFVIAKPASNVQGNGVSVDFTIDSSDLARVMQISFDYVPSSTNFVAGNTTTDSDVVVYIYDITNATVIQPSSFRLFSNSTSTPGTFIGNFQTASNSTSYRLILHFANTTATAYDFKFDNVNVSRSNYLFGSNISDWLSYTPTLTGFGTPTSVEFQYRRVGSDCEIRGKFTSGTSTATEARVSLPSGLSTPSTSVIPSIQICGASTISASSATGYLMLVEPSVTYLTFGQQSGTQNGLTKRNGDTVVTSGQTYTFFAKVPIAGWAAATQSSDQADQRVVAMVANGNTGTYTNQTITNWTNKPVDTHAAFNQTTGVYTIPVSGNYEVTLHTFGSSGANATIQKNGTDYVLGQSATRSFASAIISCVAGDTISGYITSGATTLQVGTTGTVLSIQRISGPTAITSTETIACRYTNTAGTTVNASTTPIPFATLDFDTHNAFSSGTFTAPASGIYMVQAKLNTVGTSNLNMDLYKNGSFYADLNVQGTTGRCSGSTLVRLRSGETVNVQANMAGGTTLATGAGVNYISIFRVGI